MTSERAWPAYIIDICSLTRESEVICLVLFLLVLLREQMEQAMMSSLKSLELDGQYILGEKIGMDQSEQGWLATIGVNG